MGRRWTNPLTSWRRIVSETLAIDLDQAGAVSGFLGLHFLEHLGGRRVGIAQPVDPAVFLFERDRQRHNLPFRQIFEVLGHVARLPSAPAGTLTRNTVTRNNKWRPFKISI